MSQQKKGCTLQRDVGMHTDVAKSVMQLTRRVRALCGMIRVAGRTHMHMWSAEVLGTRCAIQCVVGGHIMSGAHIFWETMSVAMGM